MVRNRVATAAMMPVIHTVMLLMTARGVVSAANAGVAGAARARVVAVMVVAAQRMRLRYMGGHTSRPSAWGVSRKRMGGVAAGWGRAVGALLLHGVRRWVRREHGHLGRPAPTSLGGAGNRAATGRHSGGGRFRFLAHQGLQLGAQLSTRTGGGTQLAPN